MLATMNSLQDMYEHTLGLDPGELPQFLIQLRNAESVYAAGIRAAQTLIHKVEDVDLSAWSDPALKPAMQCCEDTVLSLQMVQSILTETHDLISRAMSILSAAQ